MSDSDEDAVSSSLEVRYANYFRVGYTAFEVLLDFGLYHPDRGQPVMHTRIVANPVYAKELSRTLEESLDGYERNHGPIPEPDEGPPR